MKKIILSLAVALIAAASCQKPEAALPVSDQFTASVESFDSPTRTSMNSDRQVVWSEGDRLAIFHGSTIAKEYQIADASVGKTNGIFNRVVADDQSGDSFYAGTEMPCNVAFYPYAESLALVGKMLEERGVAYDIENVVLPAVQYYAENSFPDGAFPMVAVTESVEENVLQFKNILGAMKLQLKGTQTVKSVKIEGKNDEALSGAAVVTAYTNNLTPAITMTGADDVSKSVTLDCGAGIQLSESTATDFIIALPPVLFCQGFTVTVTDSNDETYTIETDKANTVLRSSILTMPTITLNAAGSGDPEEGEDDVTYIEYVFLSKSSLTMMPNTSYTLVADIDPIDVTYPTLIWSSSDNAVAEVDQSGKVTAKSDGNVTITALAVGGESASCSVTVKTPKAFAEGDYIDYVDELGVNHGKGIAVAGVIWAPVNCGYEPANGDNKGYPYGKLYQWGRKYGQGYSTYYDATEPEIVEGPVVPSQGSLEANADKFFKVSSSPYNWCTNQIDDLWKGENGEKTDKDPCPTGWRVPTRDELETLTENHSAWTAKEDQNGYYFVGEYTYMDDIPQVFFPAAGYRYRDGVANDRGYYGYYWSSVTDSTYASFLYFSSSNVYMRYNFLAYGYSVRCVQVTD